MLVQPSMQNLQWGFCMHACVQRGSVLCSSRCTRLWFQQWFRVACFLQLHWYEYCDHPSNLLGCLSWQNVAPTKETRTALGRPFITDKQMKKLSVSQACENDRNCLGLESTREVYEKTDPVSSRGQEPSSSLPSKVLRRMAQQPKCLFSNDSSVKWNVVAVGERRRTSVRQFVHWRWEKDSIAPYWLFLWWSLQRKKETENHCNNTGDHIIVALCRQILETYLACPEHMWTSPWRAGTQNFLMPMPQHKVCTHPWSSAWQGPGSDCTLTRFWFFRLPSVQVHFG